MEWDEAGTHVPQSVGVATGDADEEEIEYAQGMSPEEILEQKPVMIYRYVVTMDPQDPDRTFARKLELGLLNKDQIREMIVEYFDIEKEQIKPAGEEPLGGTVPDEEGEDEAEPEKSDPVMKQAHVIFQTFDGREILRITRENMNKILKPTAFVGVLKRVVSFHKKYVRDKAKEAEKKT